MKRIIFLFPILLCSRANALSINQSGIGVTSVTLSTLTVNNSIISGSNTVNGSAIINPNGSIYLASATFQVGGGTFTVTSNGHIRIHGAGSNPTVSSCGTGSPTIATGSSDIIGSVTTGTGANAACTITFGSIFSATPFCVCNDKTNPTVCIVQSATASSIILKSTQSFNGADVLGWQCFDN